MWALSNSPCVLLCPCLSSSRLAVLCLWFRGALKPVWFSLSWLNMGGCKNVLGLGLISLLWGIPGGFYTIVSWLVVQDAPLHPSQTAQVLWPTRDTEKRVLQGLRLSCSPSLPNEVNLRQTAKVSANSAACVGTSACPCHRSQISHQAADPLPVFLPFSIPSSWDTCSSATHPPFGYRIHLTGKKGGWAHPSSAAFSNPPVQLQLRLCSPALHVLCLRSRRGWVKKEFIY